MVINVRRRLSSENYRLCGILIFKAELSMLQSVCWSRTVLHPVISHACTYCRMCDESRVNNDPLSSVLLSRCYGRITFSDKEIEHRRVTCDAVKLYRRADWL